jgi:hypothetical protein
MSRNLKISGAIVLALVLGIAALAIAMDAPPDEQEAVATPEAAATAPPPDHVAGSDHDLDRRSVLGPLALEAVTRSRAESRN